MSLSKEHQPVSFENLLENVPLRRTIIWHKILSLDLLKSWVGDILTIASGNTLWYFILQSITSMSLVAQVSSISYHVTSYHKISSGVASLGVGAWLTNQITIARYDFNKYLLMQLSGHITRITMQDISSSMWKQSIIFNA